MVRFFNSTVGLLLSPPVSPVIFPAGRRPILAGWLFLLLPLLSAARPAADSVAVSPDKFFYFIFDNDATFKTDYYYTQGIGIVHYNPVFRKSPLAKILLQPGGVTAERFYGLAYKYDAFTPTNIRDPQLRLSDRPYASYMYVSQVVGATRKSSQQRFTNSLDLGFLGPATGAGKFQRLAHEFLQHGVPQGWQYQIKTDVILNYHALYQQGIITTRPLEVIGEAGASLGTLYTNATAGALIRVGWMNAYLADLGISNKTSRQKAGRRSFQFYAYGRSRGKLVGYDATMQGGVFNRGNRYTLPAAAITRTVLESQTGLVCLIKGLRLESAVHFISPEFKGSRPHKWMHFNVGFGF